MAGGRRGEVAAGALFPRGLAGNQGRVSASARLLTGEVVV